MFRTVPCQRLGRMFGQSENEPPLDSWGLHQIRGQDHFLRRMSIRIQLRTSGLEKCRWHATAQNTEYFERLYFFFQRLGDFLCRRTRKRPVIQQLYCLINKTFIFLSKPLIFSYLSCFESLQNIYVISPALLVRNTVVHFEACGGGKGLLVHIKQRIELFGYWLTLFRNIGGLEDSCRGKEVQFIRTPTAFIGNVELVEPSLAEVGD